jgi:DNA-binding NarL/FixJ family response regulator
MMSKISDKRPAIHTRVLLVEDHPMLRESMVYLINKELGMEVCGETDNVQQAMELIRDTRPDIAIVDISLRGTSGLELIKDIKSRGITVPVLVLSMHDENLYAERALRAGAQGYITKSQASSVVIEAIKTVRTGEVYVSSQLAAKIIKRVAIGGAGQASQTGMDLLADRELEVFELIGSGHSVKEIAELLNLGESTVDTYRARIKEKLGLRSAAEVVLRAGQWVKDRS